MVQYCIGASVRPKFNRKRKSEMIDSSLPAQCTPGVYVPDVQEIRYADKEERRTAVKAFVRCFLALTVFDILTAIAVFAVEQISCVLFGIEATIALFENCYFNFGLQIFAVYICGFTAFALMLRGMPKNKGIKARMSAKEFWAALLIMQGSMFIFSFVSDFISTYLNQLLKDYIRYDVSGMTSMINAETPIWLIIAVVVIISPIIEEITFRKILIDRLSVYGDRIALVFSAVTFGIFHGNVEQLLYTIAGGFVFGYIYVKTRRIGLSCLAHIIGNFLGTVPSILIQSMINDLPTDVESMTSADLSRLFIADALSLIYAGLVFALMIGAVVVLINALMTRSIYVSKTASITLPSSTKMRALIFNIGALLFIAVMALNYTKSLGITGNYISELFMLLERLTVG